MSRRKPRRRSGPPSPILDALRGLELVGRPVVHEQGNTVLRGRVLGGQLDEVNWRLGVGEVERLDKRTGTWRPDAEGQASAGVDAGGRDLASARDLAMGGRAAAGPSAITGEPLGTISSGRAGGMSLEGPLDQLTLEWTDRGGQRFLELGAHAMVTVVGPSGPDPWGLDWPDAFDTDFLDGGPLG